MGRHTQGSLDPFLFDKKGSYEPFFYGLPSKKEFTNVL
jgi:hypothetical protein